MDIKPVNNNILIEVDKDAEETAGGVVVQHSKGERTASKAIKGKVVLISEKIVWEKLKQDPMDPDCVNVWEKYEKVSISQTVWIAKWEGQELSYNGREFIVVKPEHILCVRP